MEQVKNINIGFISKGLNAYNAHIKPFIDNVPNENYRFFIFHINKYYSPEIQLELSNITCVDLTKVLNYKLVISKYEIDVMISLNPGNIFDLFFLSICKLQDVTTVYYQHGIQLDFSLFDPKILSQNKSTSRKLLSLKKYIFFYTNFALNICLNAGSRVLYDAVITKTRHLFFVIRNKAIIPKYGLKNNHCDLAFVYGENDKNYLISSMEMNKDNIFISGYPFMHYNKYENGIDSKIIKQEKTALYLSTALRTVGVIPITIEEEESFYLKVYQQVNDAGYKLVIKLHPLEDEELFKSYFKGKDVEISRIANLSDLTYESDIIIGEYTTAFFYPIREYKPIIIINSPYFEEYPFDYTRFGIGTKTNVDDLSRTIKENSVLTNKDKTSYDVFSKNYINYNKNESSFSRVYKCIEVIINKNSYVNY